ncbi:MAG: hypothetical protein II942_04855 [Alphaproteobacteria bacterium]|nr:hypothetical protein [Alphaproteobacteria bacterium]
MNETFFQKLFSFRFVSLCGILMALYVFSLTTDAKPISTFLFNPTLYLVASLVAVAVRVLLWITVDKGTFYEFSHILWQTIEDCVIINIVLLCTLSFLFLVTSFV